jgi:adenylate kinase
VNDEIVIDLVAERLADLHVESGFVLDGFPRTVEQALALEVLMEERGLLIAVEISVPDEELLRRLQHRRAIERREDDDDAVGWERLAEYHRATEAVIDFYRKRQMLVTVNGDLPPEAVTERITLAVDPVFDEYFDSLV